MFKKSIIRPLTIALYTFIFLCALPRPDSYSQSKLNSEEWLACTNLSGLNFSISGDFNERELQKYKILYKKGAPTTIILGSSRILHLNSEVVGDATMMNYGMSGCSLEDILGLYSLYEGKRALPKRIILGLDPWILNANNNQGRWGGLKESYLQMTDLLINKKKIPKIKNDNVLGNFTVYSPSDFEYAPHDFDSATLSSITYRKFSLSNKDSVCRLANKYIRTPSLYDTLVKSNEGSLTNTIQALASETFPYRTREFEKLTPYQKYNISKLNHLLLALLFNFPDHSLTDAIPTLESINDIGIYYKNGGHSYSKEYRERDTAIVNSTALSYASYSIADYSEFAPKLKQLFELFINHLTEKKIEVIFFLVPYHPKVYSLWNTDAQYSKALEFESYVKQIALQKKNRVRVIGSLNPQFYHLSNSDFYDGMHIKPNGLIRVLGAHDFRMKPR